MGMPGNITVEITTVFDAKNATVSRRLRFVDGIGLNSLVSSELGDAKWWDINSSIMADTIDLPDEVHKLDRQHVEPDQFDYKWLPVKLREEDHE